MAHRRKQRAARKRPEIHVTPTAAAAGVQEPESATQPQPDAAQVMDAVAALWAKVKPTMFERVSVIEEATLALMEGALDDESRHKAEREAHKITGAVGTFGFTDGSRLASQIELLLGSPTRLTNADALRLADLVVELRRQLDGEPTAEDRGLGPSDESSATDILSLLVVSADPDLTTGLQAEATARGLEVHTAPTVTDACAETGCSSPAVILLDLASTGDLNRIDELTERYSGAPVVVLTGHVSFDDRAQIARRGTRYLLTKPQSPRKIVETAFKALLARDPADASILVVDDDPEMLLLLDTMLKPAGLRLTLVDQPDLFWDALDEMSPDLVILDLDLPGVDGLDLCRMLRNDPRRDGVPVLFLTVRSDPDVIQQMFAAGADDYVNKPVVGPELLTRISNRLERTRSRRAMAESDPLTGLANRHKAELAFDQFFRIAARQNVPLALAILEVDEFEDLSRRYGRAMADQVLRHLAHLMVQRFRGHDVAARWDGERFAVGLFGAGRDIGVLRLSEILDTLQHETFVATSGETFSATFSAGVAEYPIDGRTLRDLYSIADEALCQAREGGSCKVVASRSISEPRLVDHTIDVVLVDDDTALASLLLHALANRGYRTEWYQDGEAAVHALTAPESRVQTRVVLLDVGLPSLDGFDVLRRLVDSDITQRTRVIMLTAHSSESEVLEALQLGAFDHVAKPFSTPVLLQRIRRAMRG